jgi:hypothetical protein
VTTHGLSGVAQPTTDSTARDVSATPIDASAGLLRSLPCVCGGIVTADPACPAVGVRIHQTSLLHRIWRRRAGIL